VEMPHPPYAFASGLVRMADGDAAGALHDFRRAGELLVSIWRVESPAVLPWRSAAARAALHAGMSREAAAFAAAELKLARRTGVASVLARALRTEALVSGAEQAIGLLREALDLVRHTDHALETVRTHVEFGIALRRAGGARRPAPSWQRRATAPSARRSRRLRCVPRRSRRPAAGDLAARGSRDRRP
jgi:hypothetical protein